MVAALIVTLMVALGGVCLAGADLLVLKNGERMVGTIVGFENGMFRVETDFGIALVRKDKIASIQFSASPDKVSQPSVPRTPVARPLHEKSKAEHREAESEAASTPDRTEAAPAPAKPFVPVSRPLNQPLPAHLQEHVEGTTYFSDTFHFAMYKPPDWKVYEGVPRETGSGIMAMGTENEQTILIVDRQVWSGPPDLKTDQVIIKLRENYQDFRRLSEEQIKCDGRPAMRRAFTGVLDGAEWHGIAVHVADGNTVFSIIGLTSAELFEFQQAVLNKIIKSFHFVPPASGQAAKAASSPDP